MTRPVSLCAAALLLVGCGTARAPADTADDEVDIGYGTRPAGLVTGAVSRVEPDEAERSTAVTVLDLLVGRVPGLDVSPSATGGAQLVIRGPSSFYGSNEPLVVVDGMTLTSARGLLDINPSDVALISVLKGSEAAIYGSRGANGVILIRTRR